MAKNFGHVYPRFIVLEELWHGPSLGEYELTFTWTMEGSKETQREQGGYEQDVCSRNVEGTPSNSGAMAPCHDCSADQANRRKHENADESR
jgi:hypothetical protein